MTQLGDNLNAPSPVERYRAAEAAMDHHRAELGRHAQARRDAVFELRDSGIKINDIADLLGVTRQTIYRILKAEGRPVQP